MSRVRALLALLVALAIFIAAALTLSYADLWEIISSLLLGVCVSIVIRYALDTWHAVHRPYFSGAEYLIIGTVTSWACIGLLRLWGVLLRADHQPNDLAQSYVTALLLYLTMLGAALLVIAPGAEARAALPARNVRLVLLAIGIGGVVAAGVIAYLLPD